METMSFHRSSEIGELPPYPAPQLSKPVLIVFAAAWGAGLGAIVSRKGDRGRGALIGAAVNGGGALAVALLQEVVG